MTGHASGGPPKGAGWWARTGRWESAGAILLVLAGGLAFRVIIAYLLPGSGFANDLASFQGWANDLATGGPYGFYERASFIDYTPGYLYVLWLVGIVGQAMGGIGDLIKIPPMLADLALGWLAWSIAQELGASRRSALFAAAVVVFNPITWFDSVVWGQVDAFGVVFLLLGARELWRDRPERAALWTVVAAVIKPQLGILVPIVAFVTLRRALAPDDGATLGAGLPSTTRWERETRGAIRILTTGLTGLATAVVLSAPFKLSIIDLIVQVGRAAAGYPYLTVNAYNPWALLTATGADGRVYGLADGGTWIFDAPLADAWASLSFGPLPAVVVGTALLLVCLFGVSAVVARRPSAFSILVGLAVLALVFFVVPTRVHERYLFPFVVLAAIPAAVAGRWLLAYVAVCTANFLNLYVVLTTIYDNPSVMDWLGIGGTIRSSAGVTVIAVVHLAGLIWVGLQLRRGAVRRLAVSFRADGGAWSSRPSAASALEPGSGGADGLTGRSSDPAPVELPSDPAPVELPSDPAPVEVPGGPPEPEVVELPRWHVRRSFAELGLVGWLRARIRDRPIRADRSAALHGERGGRLDRLDLWLVIVLVVGVLTLRTWRLAEPYKMHFDEVYHARTATEFLQHWRYGLSHDIYEWTHPHLAKYAIALGLVAWGDDRIETTSNLGVPVRDAAVQPRRDDLLRPGERAGDRLLVVTGSELRSYDLESRRLEATLSIPGAASLAIDPAGRRALVGTDGGAIVSLDLDLFDFDRSSGSTLATVEPFAALDGPIRMLHSTTDGSGLVAVVGPDRLVAVDPTDGRTLGSIVLAGISGLADGTSGGLLAALVPVTGGATGEPGGSPSTAPTIDPSAAASVLGELLGGEPATYASRLVGDGFRPVAGIPFELRTEITESIADGGLAGLDIVDRPTVAVATADGVVFVAPGIGEEVGRVNLPGGAQGLAWVDFDGPTLYATTNPTDGPAYARIYLSGDRAKDGPTFDRTFRLPAPGSRVTWDPASEQVHILGAPPPADGGVAAFRTGDGPATVYVIEPHANAVYADVRLPFEPAAWAVDAAKPYPATDRQQLLAFAADGSVAAVSIGQHAFAWRFPGVIAGALMAGLLFLLGRLLFRRRSVGVLVAAFAALDGMFFVQSRIAMNDTYVGLLLVAAYTLFAWLWLQARPTGRAFWLVLPAVGLLLGLALAAKWVAVYAIGGLAILVLIRSALGRLLVILGLIGVTAVLGYQAISVPQVTEGVQPGGNLTFMLLMIGITLGAVIVNVVRPVAWSVDELRLAVGGPAGLGGLVVLGALAIGQADTTLEVAGFLVRPMEVGFALLLVGLIAWAAFRLAGSWGFGPLAPNPEPDDPALALDPPAPPPGGWLRPGWALGLPLAWLAICLVAIPVGVYVLSYVPWAMLDGNRIAAGWPADHQGQTLLELTGQMYRYHNGLTSAHAASSPWWAWPFDLKPVWFYQDSFAGGTSAAIYDPGNLVLWWLAIPAMGFAIWQGIRRRSLALGLIVVAFLCQWVPWARIDRAAFQYHYYTALPFVLLALAYFVAEIWHGASRRTWLLARIVAGLAIIGPPLAWVLHRPICGFVGVESVNPGSNACPALIPDADLTARAVLLGFVVISGTILLVRELLALGRAPFEAAEDESGATADLASTTMVQPDATAGRFGATTALGVDDAAAGAEGTAGGAEDTEDAALGDLGLELGGSPDVGLAGVRSVGRRRTGALDRLGLGPLGPLIGVALGAVVSVMLVAIAVPDVPLIRLTSFSIEPIALVVVAALLPVAAVVVTARDARRFVAGVLFAAGGWFAIAYPNLSGLPLPGTMVNMYQGVMPTYLYNFQFPVSLIDRNSVSTPLLGPEVAVLLLALAATSLIMGYSAWVWRLALAERAIDAATGAAAGEHPAALEGGG